MATTDPLVASAAATLPDAGDFEIVTTCGILFAFVWWAASTISGSDPGHAERHAFRGGMIGTGFGIAVYLTGLLTGVY